MATDFKNRRERNSTNPDQPPVQPLSDMYQSVIPNAPISHGINTRALEKAPEQESSASAQSSLQRGDVGSKSSDGPASSTSPTLRAPSQSSQSDSDHDSTTIQSTGQFDFRGLPAELRVIIYSFVWPCNIKSSALLHTLAHDSKLEKHDLKIAERYHGQHHSFTVTAMNFEAFKAMRISMERITNITIRRDCSVMYRSAGFPTLSGCHCTWRNYFETIKIHNIQDPESVDSRAHPRDDLVRILIRAAQYGNGGPTTLIITTESCNPFSSRNRDLVHEMFSWISVGLGFIGAYKELSGGTVLHAAWSNGAPLTWSRLDGR
ncbi:hypothetical protein ONS96_008924 [Cadophora gregata f. sp. sojae]|nr:hypothetical protein ONS96_008924 [Cadophora gregata f. sp. sojae]